MAGGEGFEPSTPNLGGWCSIRHESKTKEAPPFVENSRIRTELLAHKNLVNEIPIDKLLKIEKVAIYLEGKGKQPNTIDSFRRHIAVLARNANLDNPKEVELVIARYKLTDPKTKKLSLCYVRFSLTPHK